MAKASAAGRLWDIDTGHDLMISEPAAVATPLKQLPSARTDPYFKSAPCFH
jgi:hypothetical protein